LSRIFLVRHGEVEGNSGAHRTFAGWADKPLTERGELQAQAVANRLARETIGLICSSDLQRARRTAERIAAPHKLQVRTDAALREVNYGQWEGLSESEILQNFAADWNARVEDPETNAPTGGESLADLWRRLEPAWRSLVEQTESTPEYASVLVAHNGTIRVLLCQLLGVPIRHFRRIHCDNCGLCLVERKNGSWTILKINETAHLGGI